MGVVAGRVVLAVALGALAVGCGEEANQVTPSPSPAPVTTTSTTAPTAAATTSPSPVVTPPCDPGGGFPKPKSGCPDPQPETGWLTRDAGGSLRLKPFRTLGNDAEGKAYAEQHGLEYPFPNDYYDAPTGPAHRLELAPDTVCTGIIVVGHREPLEDHVVDCAELVAAAARRRVPVAVWQADGHVLQASELYRP